MKTKHKINKIRTFRMFIPIIAAIAILTFVICYFKLPIIEMRKDISDPTYFEISRHLKSDYPGYRVRGLRVIRKSSSDDSAYIKIELSKSNRKLSLMYDEKSGIYYSNSGSDVLIKQLIYTITQQFNLPQKTTAISVAFWDKELCSYIEPAEIRNYSVEYEKNILSSDKYLTKILVGYVDTNLSAIKNNLVEASDYFRNNCVDLTVINFVDLHSLNLIDINEALLDNTNIKPFMINDKYRFCNNDGVGIIEPNFFEYHYKHKKYDNGLIFSWQPEEINVFFQPIGGSFLSFEMNSTSIIFQPFNEGVHIRAFRKDTSNTFKSPVINVIRTKSHKNYCILLGREKGLYEFFTQKQNNNFKYCEAQLSFDDKESIDSSLWYGKEISSTSLKNEQSKI